MIFVIDNLKFDTSKMELVSRRCQYNYESAFLNCTVNYTGKNVKLFRSKKGNWLLTYETDYKICGVRLQENDVKNLLIKYDVQMYEQIFGELEEA
jgi:hypothetical protein